MSCARDAGQRQDQTAALPATVETAAGGLYLVDPPSPYSPMSGSIRQADIVLGECGCGSLRAEQIVELRELNLVIEGIVRNPMQQRRHPPGETLGLPYPRQRAIGVVVEPGIGFVGIVFNQRL